MEELLEQLGDAICSFREAPALEATSALLDAGCDPRRILDEGLAAAMTELGARWQRGLVFLPQVMVASRIFARCAALVEPVLLAKYGAGRGTPVLLATVKGDMHDLGKNIVGAMLKVSGFEVEDLGVDVPAARIVEAVTERRPRIVGLSAMLTTTMPAQREVIEALETAGLRGSVCVVVGGAPVSSRWAEEVGADGYGANSADAVRVFRELTHDAPR